MTIRGDLGYSYGPKFDAALDESGLSMEPVHEAGLAKFKAEGRY